MSPDLIHASKPIIRLLIDADVIFFWQYSAEPQKIVNVSVRDIGQY
jgi:hypothetical protein